MKRLRFFFMAALIAAFLSACFFYPPVTFENVSQPYLDLYGPPEETSEYNTSGYHTVDWWWWSLGHQVTFADIEGDGVNGWTVFSTYDFDPI